MRTNYWAKIRKIRLHDVDKPWLIKIYPPGEEKHNGWLGTSRARTFEDAIKTAHQNIEYEVKVSKGLI